jgi:hypothetical protein
VLIVLVARVRDGDQVRVGLVEVRVEAVGRLDILLGFSFFLFLGYLINLILNYHVRVVLHDSLVR